MIFNATFIHHNDIIYLIGIITMIMVRTLRRDIAKYNADESYDETIEETGWKLVHGDVFRPPKSSRLFAAFVGSGIQIFWMSFITICKLLYGKIVNSFKQRSNNYVSLIILYLLSSFRHVRHALTCIKRCLNNSCHNILYDSWSSRWIFFRETI